MSMLNLFAILPAILVILLVLAVAVFRKVQFPSPLLWGCIVNRVVPVRAHLVLDYNEEIDEEEPVGGRLGREARRQQFKVNWGYLCAETLDTTLFLQALRFEKLKISAAKPGMQYEPREVAVVELINEATELRWKQVHWQVILQLRAKLGLKIDRGMFLTLLVHYKNFEEHMVALAETEGNWLKDMLLERLGLMEWRVINGGQSEPELA